MAGEDGLKIFSLLESGWNYLVVLDACRYDYFASLHGAFFSGILEKRWSRGFNTPSWCRTTFEKHYDDIVYVSGNSFINSKVRVAGCDAGKKFYEVVDVWDFGWDDILGTVPPWTLTQVALNYARKRPGKRLIIHYMQPHAPYLDRRFRMPLNRPKPRPESRGRDRKSLYERFAWKLAKLATRLRVVSHPWLVIEMLGLPPATPLDAVRRVYGVEGLRAAYRENLRIVLKYVAVLVHELSRLKPGAKIIITSDHGELLGEDGLFGHNVDHPVTRIVPWFQVDMVKYVPEDALREVARYDLRMRIKKVVGGLRQGAVGDAG